MPTGSAWVGAQLALQLGSSAGRAAEAAGLAPSQRLRQAAASSLAAVEALLVALLALEQSEGGRVCTGQHTACLQVVKQNAEAMSRQ